MTMSNKLNRLVKPWPITLLWLLSLFLNSNAFAQQVKLEVGLDTPVMLAGQDQTAYLKVGLTGYALDRQSARTPVNVAIVLDQSGSMTGEKMRRAKEAAQMAVDLLTPNDTVALISYSDTVNVIVPATSVQNKHAIGLAINQLRAAGSTALFAGISKGAHEVYKYLDPERVNRIILLSDGLANVGPSSPAELGDFGAALAKKGISVSTLGLGLGYNEDLMVQLALKSDGNHAFVENARDLARIFEKEFNDVLSVTAQNINIQIRCSNGIKPLRVLGRNAEIIGQNIVTKFNQLYSNHEKYLLIEVAIPASAAQQQRPIATVDIDYADMQKAKRVRLSRKVAVAFSNSTKLVRSKTNRQIKGDTVEQLWAKTNAQAVQLRDQGKIKDAKQLLLDNADFIGSSAALLPERQEKLRKLEAYNKKAASNLDQRSWSKTRKSLRKKTYELEQQQRY